MREKKGRKVREKNNWGRERESLREKRVRSEGR